MTFLTSLAVILAAVADALALQSTLKEPPSKLLTISDEISEADAFASQAVETKMAEVVSRMDTAVQESQEALTRQAELFRHKTRESEDALHRVELANEAIAQNAAALRNENAALRAKAEELRTNATRLMDELKRLRSNVSIAQDFVAEVLNQSLALSDAPQVKVLGELKKSDAADAARQQREQTLKELAGSSAASLLQLRSSVRPSSRRGHGHKQKAPNVTGVAKRMLQTLESITHERDESNATLVKSFHENMERLAAGRSQALAEQAKLNASLAEQQEVKVALQAAVNHLEGLQAKLLRQRESFRQFASKLGQRALPVNESEAEADPAPFLKTVQTPKPAVLKAKATAHAAKRKAGALNRKAPTRAAKRKVTAGITNRKAAGAANQKVAASQHAASKTKKEANSTAAAAAAKTKKNANATKAVWHKGSWLQMFAQSIF